MSLKHDDSKASSRLTTPDMLSKGDGSSGRVVL